MISFHMINVPKRARMRGGVSEVSAKYYQLFFKAVVDTWAMSDATRKALLLGIGAIGGGLFGFWAQHRLLQHDRVKKAKMCN